MNINHRDQEILKHFKEILFKMNKEFSHLYCKRRKYEMDSEQKFKNHYIVAAIIFILGKTNKELWDIFSFLFSIWMSVITKTVSILV